MKTRKIKRLLPIILAAGILTSCAAGAGDAGTTDMNSGTITEKQTEIITEKTTCAPKK